MTEPLYRWLAGQLRAAITGNALAPGAQLPTEHQLCAEYGVSRHTAREALRLLQEEGLIARRRGAGTVVAGSPAESRFAQTLGGMAELLQYAREARLFPTTKVRPLLPTSTLARTLRLNPRLAWTAIVGLRIDAGRPPLALTRIAVQSALAPNRAALNAMPGALNEWIAEVHGVRTAKVTQEISAVALPVSAAQALEAAPQSPALQTIRRYYDASGDMIQASLSLHPGDRFVYAMAVERS